MATSVSELSDLYDWILISVKAHATGEIVRDVGPFLRAGGMAISLQNGLGNIETLAVTFGPARSLGQAFWSAL